MADTVRTLSYLLNTEFPDGQVRAISAQYIRDLIVSINAGGLTPTAAISSGTIAGVTNANFALVGGTVTYAGASTSLGSLTATLAGTTTSTTLGVWDETIADGAKTNGTGPISYVKLTANAGGANFNGGRNAMASIINYSGSTNNKVAGLQGFQTALYGNINVTGNDGGTATTGGNCQGSFAGFNPSMIISAAATNLNTVFGGEIDMIVRSGASVSQLSHLVMVNSTNHAVRGTNEDCFIGMSGSASAMTHESGILFGCAFSEWPFATDSTLIRCEISQDALTVPSVAWSGFDGSVATFGDSFLRSRQFTVDQNGSVQVGQGVLSAITGGIQIDATGSVGPAETSTITSAIVSGGTTQVTTSWWRDAYGGLYRAGVVVAGAVTSLTVYRQPFCKGATPSNPITLSPNGLGRSRGCTPVTINITWTTGSTVALNPTGAVTAPTASPGDNSTKVATTAFVQFLAAGGYVPTYVYFFASLSANQTITGATLTKLQANTVGLDNLTYYDNVTNFRFTPLTAGKYKVTASLTLLCSASANGAQGIAKKVAIYKNGTIYCLNQFLAANSNNYWDTLVATAVISMNGTTDYLEAWGSAPGSSGTAFVGGAAPIASWFEACYIGV